MIADWVIELLSDVEWFMKTNNFLSDRRKRQKLSKEFKTTVRWPKALINSPFAASIFVICMCYSPSWTVFEILMLPINPRTAILCRSTTRILKRWTRSKCYIYLPTCASSWWNIFTIWSGICLFVCSVYIPLRNSTRETRLDNDHFQSLQDMPQLHQSDFSYKW